jgi:dTDP-4-amino-4,6-dideoxygalactose transaminase
VRFLNDRGVGTSVYYPKPVPLLTYYREKYGYNDGEFPVACRISGASIALPVGPHLGREDIEWIGSSLKQAIASVL